MSREFGELEAAVMERLWAWGRPASVRDVYEHLLGNRVLAYTTVMTVMDRLHRKNVLQRELMSRAYFYQPVLTREQYMAGVMKAALGQSTDRTAVLLHFVADMTADERSALRTALRRATAHGG